jgi:hypothetical protein
MLDFGYLKTEKDQPPAQKNKGPFPVTAIGFPACTAQSLYADRVNNPLLFLS